MNEIKIINNKEYSTLYIKNYGYDDLKEKQKEEYLSLYSLYMYFFNYILYILLYFCQATFTRLFRISQFFHKTTYFGDFIIFFLQIHGNEHSVHEVELREFQEMCLQSSGQRHSHP